MSSEQERPVLSNSIPMGCQITSVLTQAVTAIRAFQDTLSHYVAISEITNFHCHPFMSVGSISQWHGFMMGPSVSSGGPTAHASVHSTVL